MKSLSFKLILGLLAALLFCGPAMAASTFTSTQGGSYNLYQPRGGEGASVTETYEVTTALVINDVIQMVKVPKNCTVTDVKLIVDDLDTGTTITLSVGNGDDPDYFISASTVGQAGGVARADAATGFPLALTANDTIDVLVAAAPTGGGTGTVTLVVDYVVTR